MAEALGTDGGGGADKACCGFVLTGLLVEGFGRVAAGAFGLVLVGAAGLFCALLVDGFGLSEMYTSASLANLGNVKKGRALRVKPRAHKHTRRTG